VLVPEIPVNQNDGGKTGDGTDQHPVEALQDGTFKGNGF